LKIRILNGLLIIDILTVLLILAITFIPSSPVRIVLGLPFLLFFPGYVLVEALFVRRKGAEFEIKSKSQDTITKQIPNNKDIKEGEKGSGFRIKSGMTEGEERGNTGEMGGIERVALSFGVSIAVTVLIGLGLNYTPWGIRLEPVLYSISAFIIILSAVALFRQDRVNGHVQWLHEVNLRLPGWEGSTFNKSLAVILVVVIIGAIGVLGYTIAKPKIGEKFTEFYILGQNGQADVYPSAFTLQNGKVVSVQYGDGGLVKAEDSGQVSLGIVNQEQAKTVYKVVVKIDGEEVTINTTNTTNSTNTTNTTNISIELEQGEKWEQEIGFAPQHIGDSQEVEFLLYKDGSSTAEDTLHLWVNVVGG
jgi:uncharacterized membrane protein